MLSLGGAVARVVEAKEQSSKPMAVILAGHNGSGKSTMWYRHLAPQLQMPLINADRIMMSILPEVGPNASLPDWARQLRDEDENWMRVAQNGVRAFVAEALSNKVPFAFETVFSHWQPRPDGTFASKIDQIRAMQQAGYFVVLLFVALATPALSVLRVSARVAGGGHAVPQDKLISRFPRTQQAIREAVGVADAAILVDNSRDTRSAFTVARVQLGHEEAYDRRRLSTRPPKLISAWLDVVSPMQSAS